MRHLVPLLLICGCALPVDDLDGDGWSVAAGDCDDLDPRVNPDATDPISDGLDQDCDGVDPLMVVQGEDHSCQITQDHDLRCDGDNSLGQTDVPDVEASWVKITAGAYHTCALAESSTVACWGDDTWGQSSPPFTEQWVDITASGDFTVGVRETGAALCWGRCFGRPFD